MTWPTVRLGDLMPTARSSIDPRKSPDEEFDLFSIPAFDAGRPEVVRGADVGSSKQTLMPGDVLLSKIVPHIRRACVVPSKSERPMIGSSEWIIFRSVRFDPAYLRHALVSDRVHRAFMQTVAGVGGSLLRARPSHVAEIEIPLPPIEEQRRIAAILDAADALRTKRRQTLEKLDALTQSIFIAMFGAGSESPVSPHGALSANEMGWPRRRILEVAQIATGHTPDRKVSSYWDGDISWVNLNEIREFDGRICFGTRARITDAGVMNSSAVVLPQGTVCFSRTASIGFVAIMGIPMATSQDFVNWICGNELNPRYLMDAFLMSREALRASSSGSTHKTIYMRDAERFSVLVPPRQLQDEYADRAEAIQAAETKAEASVTELDALFASLQHRAFRGEL